MPTPYFFQLALGSLQNETYLTLSSENPTQLEDMPRKLRVKRNGIIAYFQLFHPASGSGPAHHILLVLYSKSSQATKGYTIALNAGFVRRQTVRIGDESLRPAYVAVIHAIQNAMEGLSQPKEVMGEHDSVCWNINLDAFIADTRKLGQFNVPISTAKVAKVQKRRDRKPKSTVDALSGDNATNGNSSAGTVSE